MSLFLSLLPIYIFGNLHCAGMCGPLVILLARHPYRWLYFLGRIISFTFMGLLSAEIGISFFWIFAHFHLSALLSIILGISIVFMGFGFVFNWKPPWETWLSKKASPLSSKLASLIAAKSARSAFLFGFFTVLLPCGQTLVVFSACALNGESLAGLFNGLFFALLTTPSLIAAMHAAFFFPRLKKNAHLFLGIAVIFVGFLSTFRGFADLTWIPHLVINQNAPSNYHIVLF